MTRMLQQRMQLAALLVGSMITSAAFALATAELTSTSVIRDDTTLRLENIVGDTPYVLDKNKRSVNLPAGDYKARLLYLGLPVGNEVTITLYEGPNRLEVDTSGNVKVLPPEPVQKPIGMGPRTGPPAISASVGPGFARQDGVFYAVNPVTDQPLVRGPNKTDTVAMQVVWRLPNGVELNAGGIGGSGRNSTEVPAGQQAGITFDAPQNGVTGFSSNGGGDVTENIRISNAYLGVTLPSQVFKDEEDSWWRGFILFGGRYTETKDRGTFSVVADPRISSTTDMKTKEYDFRAGYELRGEHTFPNLLKGSVGIGAEAIYYHAKYDGTQNFACPICSAATQMFSVSTGDSKNRLIFGALGTAGLSYPISERVSLSFTLRYESEFGAPKLVTKISPTDAATHLERGNRELGSAQLGVTIKL